MSKFSLLAALTAFTFTTASAHAGIVLGAAAGPKVGGDPTLAGGSFGGEIGFMFSSKKTAEEPPLLRWGFAFEAGAAVLASSDGTLGGSDLALVSKFHWRLGAVYIGPRAGIMGHFYQYKPQVGERQTETRQFGFVIGPELVWPIAERTSLGARLSYESTNEEMDGKPNAHPPHAFDLSFGIAREF